MNFTSTTHIDFTGGHSMAISPVSFPEHNLVISFATRGAAEAAIAEARMESVTAFRLYDKGDKHGS